MIVLRTVSGVTFYLDLEGYVLSRTDGPEGWDYAKGWRILGFLPTINTPVERRVTLRAALAGADTGQGWVVDWDHGYVRVWANPSGRRLASVAYTGMQWRFADSTGVEHDGIVEKVTDRGGTDVTHTMRANCGAVKLLSGALLQAARTLNTSVPAPCAHEFDAHSGEFWDGSEWVAYPVGPAGSLPGRPE
jgi:hypothetical protein